MRPGLRCSPWMAASIWPAMVVRSDPTIGPSERGALLGQGRDAVGTIGLSPTGR
jgi:hypothetical protein